MATSDRDSRVESGPRTHVQPPPVQTVEASADDRSLFDELFGILPAWVISMILHMVAVLLAGMWIIPVEKEDPWITLSTSISDQELEGKR